MSRKMKIGFYWRTDTNSLYHFNGEDVSFCPSSRCEWQVCARNENTWWNTFNRPSKFKCYPFEYIKGL